MISKILFAATAIFATAFAVEKEDGVLVLTDSNFDDEVKKHEFLLVEFYAPWCGHCKALAPEYAEAAKTLAKKDPPLYLAKVDATANEKLAQRFGVEGYPTLKWLVNGKDSEYSGGRTADTIVSWVTKKTGPAFEDVACDQVGAKTADPKLSVVFLGDEQSGALFDAFKQAAQALDNFSFFATKSACASEYGAAAPGVVLFRKFDEPQVVYSGDANYSDLTSFMKTNSVATFFEFSEDSVEPIFHDQQAVILLMLNGDQPYKAVFEEVSKEMKGEILFSYSGVTEGIQEQLGEFIGVTEKDLPTVRILQPGEEAIKKFKYEGDVLSLTADQLKQFIKDFKADKLTQFLKSEPIPEDNSGPVKVIVGHSWEEIVNDKTKDVLVKYYAPWCGHCQALAPHWDKLGEHVKDVSDLVIAKYDATANENESVSIEGFPTLTFYPKDNKEGVSAEGRGFNSLRKWLKENSSAYKAAFPDEEVSDDPEEPQDDEGDDDMGDEGDEGDDDDEEDMGEDGDEDDDMANLADFDGEEPEPAEGTEDL